ncbi:MAG: ABC transporter ATP-binding protein [Gemmatimonadota bacterium]|nr:MAG: ABC transporter ATP-binding protein [Gemmatimonadota bacterium]
MLDRESVGFIKFFAKAYPVRTAIMVPLLILSGVAEGVGLVTMLPLLEIALQDGGGGEESRLAVAVRGMLNAVNVEPTLAVLLLVVVIGITLKSSFLWLAMREAGYTVAHVATDLRLRLIRTLLRARWSYFTGQPAGHFATSIASEANRASQSYRQACLLIAGLIQVAIYLGLTFLISWRVALLALVAGVVVAVLLAPFVQISRRSGRSQTTMMKELVKRLTDALHGMKPIKAMGREEHLSPLLERETQGINEAQIRHVLASESLRAIQEPILAVMLAIGLYSGIAIAGESFSALLVMAFLFYRLVGRVNQLQGQYQTMAVGESALWSMLGIIEAAEVEAERLQSPGKLKPPPLTEGVRLEKVTFSYGPKRVLSGVSLTVPAGQFVSVIGPSGAGKTTIADLIVGLQRPDAGEVLIDGVPLREIDLVAWRHMIGYVPQEMFLLHDSVYQNVALGDPEISRDAVEQALVLAGAWDFVEQLSDGMDTPIGEAGSKLSGGQRQRVAIARALVRQPALLVLDEVTTALDPKTERAICRTLASLRGRTTLLAISHQPALMEVADTVYRLSDGMVAEVERRRERASPVR